jgi:hypothetical protein
LKKKKVKKKPWIDTEFKDLKKTVLDLGNKKDQRLEKKVNIF